MHVDGGRKGSRDVGQVGPTLGGGEGLMPASAHSPSDGTHPSLEDTSSDIPEEDEEVTLYWGDWVREGEEERLVERLEEEELL